MIFMMNKQRHSVGIVYPKYRAIKYYHLPVLQILFLRAVFILSILQYTRSEQFKRSYNGQADQERYKRQLTEDESGVRGHASVSNLSLYEPRIHSSY